MSSLYALLDYLDLPVAGSEESVDTGNYRIIPALTIDAPNSEEPQDIPLGESPPCFTISGSPSTPRRSVAQEAVPFVPMLHPKQLRELEQSPGMSRRASAHVIFPLPPGTPMDAPNSSIRSPQTTDIPIPGKESTPSSSVSFFGLQLPSVCQLRRHSYDNRGPKCPPDQTNDAQGSHVIPRVEVQSSSESLSRRNSENLIISGSRLSGMKISPGQSSSGVLDSPDSRLLTARVCEGPFISTPSSRTGSRRSSGSSVNNWTLDPAPGSSRDNNNQVQGNRIKFLGTELRNVPSSRRSSFNTLSDTVMNLLGNSKVQR